MEVGLAAATRGCMLDKGDCTGETGDAESSDEEESETDSARPRRVLIGIGLVGETLSALLEDILLLWTTTDRVEEGQGERSFRFKEGSDACI